MLELLIALSVFGGVVWMVAYAIFLLMRSDADADTAPEAPDTFSRFVEERYGSRFLPDQDARRY